MALAITPETKNNLNITNTSKDTSLTWDGSDPLTWDDPSGTWQAPRVPFVRESKNTLNITNTNKV